MSDKDVICASTTNSSEKWKSKTCARIVKARGIAGQFTKEARREESTAEQIGDQIKIYLHQLSEMREKNGIKLVECSNQKTNIRKLITRIENVLVEFVYAHQFNMSNNAKRLLRTIEEKKYIDCAEKLLQHEKKMLTESKPILKNQVGVLKELILNLNSMQIRLEKFDDDCSNYLKVFRKKPLPCPKKEKFIELYCKEVSLKLPYTQTEMDGILAEHCTIVYKLDQAIRTAKEVMAKVKEEVNGVVGRKNELNESIHQTLKEKIAETNKLKQQLEQAKKDAHIYEGYYTKKCNEAKMALQCVPECVNLQEYVEFTEKKLKELMKMHEYMMKDSSNKSQAMFIDSYIVNKRRGEVKPIVSIK